MELLRRGRIYRLVIYIRTRRGPIILVRVSSHSENGGILLGKPANSARGRDKKITLRLPEHGPTILLTVRRRDGKQKHDPPIRPFLTGY